jgi:hypothetical protein
MIDKIIHLSHCLYVGNKIDHRFNETIDEQLYELPHLYAITLIKKEGDYRQALATIVVKTNLGQSMEEIAKIYSSVVNIFTTLQSLPIDNVTFVNTKINFDAKVIPTESDLLNVMTEMYTRNAIAGST